jgi:ER membrane protein complex subunit 1
MGVVFDPPDMGVSKRPVFLSFSSSLSGQASATLRSFAVLTGQLLLEKRLHDLCVQITFLPTADDSHRPDMFVLANGYTVRRMAGSNGGEILWSSLSSSIENVRSGTQFIISDIVATTTTIYLIGLEKSAKTYTLHLTSLSASTGDEIASTPVSSSIFRGLKETPLSAIPTRIQSSHGSNKEPYTHSPSRPISKENQLPLKGSPCKSFKDVGLKDHGQFIAIKPDESSGVYKLQ